MEHAGRSFDNNIQNEEYEEYKNNKFKWTLTVESWSKQIDKAIKYVKFVIINLIFSIEVKYITSLFPAYQIVRYLLMRQILYNYKV